MSTNLAPTTQILLQDNFADDDQLNPALWDYNQYLSAASSNASFLGETQFEQYLPTVSNGALQLTVQTYNPTSNPTAPTSLGSNIVSDQLFNVTATTGIAFTAVARLVDPEPGMDGGIFPYELDSATGEKNEIDFESLTKEVDQSPDQELTNVYQNQQPTSGGNPGFPQFVNDPGLTAYQTYTIEWFQDEVLWFINGMEVMHTTSGIPQGPLAMQLNFWVPDSSFSLGYSPIPGQQFTDNPLDDMSFAFEVQSVTVAQIAEVSPTLTITGTLANQSVTGTTSLAPFSNVTVTDFNAGQTDTVTVTLSSPSNGTLSTLDGGSYSVSTGTYTETGTDGAVTAALDGLVFTPAVPRGAPGESVTTTFTISVGDTASATATDSNTTVIDTTGPAPLVLSDGGNCVTYAPGGTAVAVDPELRVSDAESATLTGATIAIGAGFVDDDALNFAGQNGITGSYDASSGVMTLAGTASLADYQAALEQVSFSSLLFDPSNPTNAVPENSGTYLTFTAADGTLSSNSVTSTIVAGPTISVAGGDTENVSAGEIFGAVVSGGGDQVVMSGATSFGTLLQSGGTETVDSSGAATGTVLDGGTIEIDGGTSTVTDASGGGTAAFSQPRAQYDVSDGSGSQIVVATPSDASQITTLTGVDDLTFDGAPVFAAYEPPAAAFGELSSDLWVTRLAALTGNSQGPALPPPVDIPGPTFAAGRDGGTGGSLAMPASAGVGDVSLLAQMALSSIPASTAPAAAAPTISVSAEAAPLFVVRTGS